MDDRLTHVVAPLAVSAVLAGGSALAFVNNSTPQKVTTRSGLIRKIVREFAPTLRFDSTDPLRPVNLEAYVGETYLYIGTYWDCAKRRPGPVRLVRCRKKVDYVPGRRRLETLPTTDPLACAPARCHYYLNVRGRNVARVQSFLQLQQVVDREWKPTVYWNLNEKDATVQYWFFYLFNWFANWHEGDWEQITVEFQRRNFLERPVPIRLGYSSHEGGERRLWTRLSPGVGRVSPADSEDETSPIVYVARRSHANYFSSGPHRVRECPKLLRPVCGSDVSDGRDGRRGDMGPGDYELLPLEPSYRESTPLFFSGDYGSGNFVRGGRVRIDYKPTVTDPRGRACVYQQPLEWLYNAC